MQKPVLPPRYVNVPAGPAFDPELPDGVFRTYVQLRGLAWGKDRMDQVTVKEIMEVTGKSRSTIYGHLGILRDRGWLLFNSAHYSWLTVEFCGSGPDGEKEMSEAVDKPVDNLSGNLDCLNEDVKELKDSVGSVNLNLLPPDFKSLRGGVVRKSGQVSGNLDKNNGWHDTIDPHLAGLMERMGVFPQVYGQVAEAIRRGDWTLEQVKDLAGEILDLGDSAGPGVFVFRLKNKIRKDSEAEKQKKAQDRWRQLWRSQKEAANGA